MQHLIISLGIIIDSRENNQSFFDDDSTYFCKFPFSSAYGSHILLLSNHSLVFVCLLASALLLLYTKLTCNKENIWLPRLLNTSR